MSLFLIFLHTTGIKLNTIPSDTPLHPFFVHFPITLSFIAPIVIFLIIYLENKHNYDLWIYLIFYNILNLIMTYFSLYSGDLEHEILQYSPYLKQAIEQHERFAQIFFILQIFMTGISFLGLKKINFHKSIRWLSFILSILIIPIAGYTGNLGGKVVHNLESPKYRKMIVEEFKKEWECQKDPSKCEREFNK